MRTMKPSLGGAALAVLAVVCVGCGSSGQNAAQTRSSTRPSPAQPKTTLAPTTTSSSATTSTSTTRSASAPPPGGPVPAGFDPVSFTAVSAQDYWLLGDAPCSGPVCTSIVRTSDGGATFEGVPAPQAPLTSGTGAGLGQSAGINTLRFADAVDGYAFGSGNQGQNFYDTHDGGKTWSQPSVLAGRTIMAFTTSAGYAFVLVVTCHANSCGDLALYRSAVGSDNWSALSLPAAAGTGAGTVATMTSYGTDLWFSLTNSAQQAHQVLVMGTGSGGHFATYPSPCSAGLAGVVQASSASVLWAVCPTGMMAQALRSTDGGATWAPLDDGPLPNNTLLAAASGTTAVLVPGAGGPMSETTDGGKTWHDVAGTTAGADEGWTWAGFTDSQTGAALQVEGTPPAGWPWPKGPLPYQLWRTTDGGTTWDGPVKV